MPFLCMSKNQDNLSCLNSNLIPNWRKNLLKSPLYKCLYILFLCGVGLVIVEIATILFIVVCQLTDAGIVFLHDDDIYIVFGMLLFLTNHIMHAILNLILYEPEYENKFRLWSNTHNGFICTILTMGLYNTYLLAVYYRIHEYSKDYLCYSVYSNGLGLAIEQIPILNIFTYIKIMKRLRKAYPVLTWKFMWKLYFQARLTSYLIKNGYPYPQDEQRW